MKLIKLIAFGILAVSFVFYVGVKSSTYSISFSNSQQQTELDSLNTEIDELQIQLTTNLSRTELMEKYPDLELNDNIYYIESQEK